MNVILKPARDLFLLIIAMNYHVPLYEPNYTIQRSVFACIYDQNISMVFLFFIFSANNLSFFVNKSIIMDIGSNVSRLSLFSAYIYIWIEGITGAQYYEELNIYFFSIIIFKKSQLYDNVLFVNIAVGVYH